MCHGAPMIPVDPPHDFPGLIAQEQSRLLDLLRGLDAEDWARPTPCPAWDAAGLVAHLVGTDLSLISWLRDGHRGTAPPAALDAGGFAGWLDELQLEWVVAARRISPQLAIDVLGFLGPMVVDAVAARDPRIVDGEVTWASDVPVPRWLDHGRELTEMWIHRQQLLEALGRPSDLDPTLPNRCSTHSCGSYPEPSGASSVLAQQ